MIIFKVKADGTVQLKDIENTLKAMQAEVGGLIEVVQLFEDTDFTCIVNEEGRLLGLPVNKLLPYLAGDVFFVGVDGEEFTSLTEKDFINLAKLFRCDRVLYRGKEATDAHL